MGERDKQLGSGFTAQHWDVTQVNYDTRSGTVIVSYAWYKNKLAKEAGRSAIAQEHIEFQIDDKVKSGLLSYVTTKIEDKLNGSVE